MATAVIMHGIEAMMDVGDRSEVRARGVPGKAAVRQEPH